MINLYLLRILQLFCLCCVCVFYNNYFRSLYISDSTVSLYLHVSGVDNTSITLRWSAFDSSMAVSGYSVNVTDLDGTGSQAVYSVGGNQSELSITNLTYLSNYSFVLLALDGSGTTDTAPPVTMVIRKCMQ